MFNHILQWHKTLQSSKFDDPLFEILRLTDLLVEAAPAQTGASTEHCACDLGVADMIARRQQGMPWEYIVGKARFMGKSFHCTQDTLIPTPETQLLVESALPFIQAKEAQQTEVTVIELGTGCGNIAVSLALGSRHAKILASDISPAAVAVAQRNVKRFDLSHRISLFCGDLFAPFNGLGYEGTVDFIVCNPPYIPTSRLSTLPKEVLDYEPRVALDAGPYGINVFLRLITESLSFLKPEGMLLFEIGERQEGLVSRLFDKDGYHHVEPLQFDSKVRAFRAVKAPSAQSKPECRKDGTGS
jgi:release factor glutamine methyltransferase